jgi:hypothetical protein
MAKQTFQMHLYASERLNVRTGDHEVRFSIFHHADLDYAGSYVRPVEVEVEVPDAFDMRAAKLKDKQAELTKVRAEFTNRITQIQREISELQAIEFVEAA